MTSRLSWPPPPPPVTVHHVLANPPAWRNFAMPPNHLIKLIKFIRYIFIICVFCMFRNYSECIPELFQCANKAVDARQNFQHEEKVCDEDECSKLADSGFIWSRCIIAYCIWSQLVNNKNLIIWSHCVICYYISDCKFSGDYLWVFHFLWNYESFLFFICIFVIVSPWFN